jgi:hypothetical protein
VRRITRGRELVLLLEVVVVLLELVLEVLLVLLIAQTLVVRSEIEWSGWPLSVAVAIGADAVRDVVTRARWAGPSLRGRIAVVLL